MKKQILLPVVTILAAALILFGLSVGLNGVAAANAQAEHLQIMRTVLPDSVEFTLEPYAGDDANIVSVHKAENGFVVETCTYGYAGNITMLIGVNLDGKVTGLVVRELSETYGLGAEALTNHVFLAQFLNSAGTFAIDAAADEVDVDALTGATVTSKAIVRSVNSAVAYVTGADVASGATSWGG